MHGERTPSERLRLSPFDALPEDGPPRRDQRDLMERPFFSLAKGRRVAPILYRAGDIEVQVHAVPEHGMATIWDADVLIWAGSQIVEAADRGLAASRFMRFAPHQLLTAIGRGTGQHQYLLLKAALGRLQSTVIRTTIRHGAHWRRQQFSWINEWEERVTASGRADGMEFVLPDWFYRGVLDRQLLLTIDPAYFRLWAASSAGSTASRASTPGISRSAGRSSSGTCTPSPAASRASPTSHSISAGSPPARACRLSPRHPPRCRRHRTVADHAVQPPRRLCG